jgi:hypothetical protein
MKRKAKHLNLKRAIKEKKIKNLIVYSPVIELYN